MDMNVLWELVNNLAEVHQGIREQTQGVLQRVQMVQARQDGNAGTEATSSSQQRDSAMAEELQGLRTALRDAENHSELLTGRNQAAWTLLSEHEATLSSLISKIRPFALSHSSALAAQKANYLTLLDTERTANLELRLEIARLQEGLGTTLELARKAMVEGEKGGRVWRRKVAALRAENSVLAGVCGVKGVGEEPESEGWSSEDEEQGGVEIKFG